MTCWGQHWLGWPGWGLGLEPKPYWWCFYKIILEPEVEILVLWFKLLWVSLLHQLIWIWTTCASTQVLLFQRRGEDSMPWLTWPDPGLEGTLSLEILGFLMGHVTGSTNGTVNHVADKVKESKERCCENCRRLVSIISIFSTSNTFWHGSPSQPRSGGGYLWGSRRLVKCFAAQLPGCVRRLAAPPGLHQLPHPPRRLPPQLQTRPRVLKDPFGEPACLAEEHDVANTDKLSVTYKAE